MFDKLKKLFASPKPEATAAAASEPESPPCCGGAVHIAFRGLSDDRLYVARDRKWEEVRFYKPHGLRVFCAVCRERIF